MKIVVRLIPVLFGLNVVEAAGATSGYQPSSLTSASPGLYAGDDRESQERADSETIPRRSRLRQRLVSPQTGRSGAPKASRSESSFP
jgi:hypothetical protein